MKNLEYKQLLDLVLVAGSDNARRFGGRFTGGGFLQQVPEELACATLHLQGRRYDTYLEVGAAAGGTARFLRDTLEIPAVYVIDDNRHPKHTLRPSILPGAIEWIGNSHDPACAQQLAEWNRRFDLLLIDGDHSYEGVAADLRLVLPYLSSGGLLLLHDAVYEAGVRRLREDIVAGQYPGLQEIALCVASQGHRCGISIVRHDAIP